MNEPRDSVADVPVGGRETLPSGGAGSVEGQVAAPVHAEQYPVLSWRWIKAIVKRLGPAGPLAVMASTLPPLGGFVLLGFLGSVAPWLREMGWGGVALYMSGFIVLAALSLLPTYACSILGGYTFGFWVGFPASILSFCGSGMVSYWINRGATGDRVLAILREHPKWEAVRLALIGSGFWRAFGIITLLRIPPTSPFALANFVFGTTKAPVWPYLLGTAVGMAPRTAAVVWAAAHMSTLDFSNTGQTWLFIAGLVATFVVIAVISAIARHAVNRITGDGTKAEKVEVPS